MILELTETNGEPVIVNFDGVILVKKGPHGGARFYSWYSNKDEEADFIDVVETVQQIKEILDDLCDCDCDNEELLGEEEEEHYDLGEPI